jgi:hypothetical protein
MEPYSPDRYSIAKFIEEHKHLDWEALIKAAENEVDEPVPPARGPDGMEKVDAENARYRSLEYNKKLKGLLFWLRYGIAPAGIDDHIIELFRENLLKKKRKRHL